MSDPQKFFGGARMCSSPLSPFHVWWDSHLPGQTNMLSFLLYVHVSFMLLNDRDCAHNFTMKTLEYRNDFDTVG